MNTMLDYPLHFPGSNTTLPWAQTGMSLAVVLVALMVLVLSCCGAAALFLAACCGNRRRDTVAESGDSRWLPGIGLIDYVPVSNRSSVRVSLVLSDSMQDLEGGAEESRIPATNTSHVTQQSPSRSQQYRAGATASTQRLLYATTSPGKEVRTSHSAPASPSRSIPAHSRDQDLWKKGSKASFETMQRSISLMWSPLEPLLLQSPPHPPILTTPSPISFAPPFPVSPPHHGSPSSLSSSSPTSGSSLPTVIINTSTKSNAQPRTSSPLPPPSAALSPPPSLPAKHTSNLSLKPLKSPSQAERWSILPLLGHPKPKNK